MGETLPTKKRRMSVCVGCGSLIQDAFILRVHPDLEWHASCLKCAECAQFLDESHTCFVRDGKTFCKRDYMRLYGTKCAKCCLSFTRNDFVMRARDKVFHVDCFRCVACSRLLIPGEEFALKEDLFCRSDYDVLERASLLDDSSVCGDINENIKQADSPVNSPIGSPNSVYHASGSDALDRSTPTQPTGSSSRGPRSSSCGSTGSSGSSGRSPSGHKGAAGGSGGRSGGSESPGVGSAGAGGSGSGGSATSGVGDGASDGGSKRARDNNNTSGSESTGEPAGAGRSHKPTRVRTVLNEKQLHTLRTCYNANPRPDALMKEQLVEMTLLSPRVIRVWFQNKRCKDKKKNILMKQMQEQHQKMNQLRGMNGVPMVATDPVRQDIIQPNQVEVQSYPAPWKALSDFALHGLGHPTHLGPPGPHGHPSLPPHSHSLGLPPHHMGGDLSHPGTPLPPHLPPPHHHLPPSSQQPPPTHDQMIHSPEGAPPFQQLVSFVDSPYHDHDDNSSMDSLLIDVPPGGPLGSGLGHHGSGSHSGGAPTGPGSHHLTQDVHPVSESLCIAMH